MARTMREALEHRKFAQMWQPERWFALMEEVLKDERWDRKMKNDVTSLSTGLNTEVPHWLSQLV